MLPVAAIEQHGPHLPVYTDTCIAEGMIRRAIELLPDDLPVTFLPVQPIGKSNEHISSPGTLTSTWETATKLWLDIGDSVDRAGVEKLIVINSHGGNVPMVDIVARELRVRHDMLVVATVWSRLGHPEGLPGPEEALYGIHGGDIETSIMLHLRPDLVRMDKAIDFRSTQLDFIDEFSICAPTARSSSAGRRRISIRMGRRQCRPRHGREGQAVRRLPGAAFVDLCRDVDDFERRGCGSPGRDRVDALRASSPASPPPTIRRRSS